MRPGSKFNQVNRMDRGSQRGEFFCSHFSDHIIKWCKTSFPTPHLLPDLGRKILKKITKKETKTSSLHETRKKCSLFFNIDDNFCYEAKHQMLKKCCLQEKAFFHYLFLFSNLREGGGGGRNYSSNALCNPNHHPSSPTRSLPTSSK